MWNEAKRFLERCRLRYATDTVDGKTGHLKAYHRWLSESGLDYVTIDKSGIERFLLQQNWCRDRKKDLLCTLRQFYTFCALSNPAEGIYFAVDKSQKLPKLPAKGRIQRIIEKIDGCDEELITRNRLLVELAYGSGLRRKELCLLNVEDIDLAGRCAHVTGKGSKPRVVPLTERAILLLRQYLCERRHRRAKGPLFQNYWYGSRIKPRSLSKIFKTATGHNTHSFRHACATHMLGNGCNLRYIQELLGHTKLSTTQVYTHIDRSKLARVIARTHPRGKH